MKARSLIAIVLVVVVVGGGTSYLVLYDHKSNDVFKSTSNDLNVNLSIFYNTSNGFQLEVNFTNPSAVNASAITFWIDNVKGTLEGSLGWEFPNVIINGTNNYFWILVENFGRNSSTNLDHLTSGSLFLIGENGGYYYNSLPVGTSVKIAVSGYTGTSTVTYR
jgi:hypothetical protein